MDGIEVMVLTGFVAFLAGKAYAWIWMQYEDWWDYTHRVFNVDGDLSTPDFCWWDNVTGGVDLIRINKCVYWGSSAKRGWYISVIDPEGGNARDKKISFAAWRATAKERSHLGKPMSDAEVAHMKACLG
jgi:hypothetical protein